MAEWALVAASLSGLNLISFFVFAYWLGRLSKQVEVNTQDIRDFKKG